MMGWKVLHGRRSGGGALVTQLWCWATPMDGDEAEPQDNQRKESEGSKIAPLCAAPWRAPCGTHRTPGGRQSCRP
jgi:hypothetical protein